MKTQTNTQKFLEKEASTKFAPAISQVIKKLGLTASKVKSQATFLQKKTSDGVISLRGLKKKEQVLDGLKVKVTPNLNSVKAKKKLIKVNEVEGVTLDSPTKKKKFRLINLDVTSSYGAMPSASKEKGKKLSISTSTNVNKNTVNSKLNKERKLKPKVSFKFKKVNPLESENKKRLEKRTLKDSSSLGATFFSSDNLSATTENIGRMLTVDFPTTFSGNLNTNKKVLKKTLTIKNVNSELHKYRLETDKIYNKHLQNLNELKSISERKLKLNERGLYTVKEKIRENLGNLGVHPHNYESLLGYRKGVPMINNQKTLEGVRRVLNYLSKIVNTPTQLHTGSKMELLVIIDNVPNLDTAEGQNNYLNLLTMTVARIKPLKNLVLLPKTMKEAIRYLTSRSTVLINGDSVKSSLNLTRVGTNPENLCGVLMINPAKSKLSDLASLVFSKNASGKEKQRSDSSLGAIGSLCAKKGIPLISLCDLSSPLTYCTYPILCNTRNLAEVYLVLDLLSYGLNHLNLLSSEESI